MEANTVFVVHRRASGEEEPDQKVAESVQEVGTAVRLPAGVWHLRTDKTGVEIFDRVRKVIGHTDQLLVIDAADGGFHSVPDAQAGVLGGPTS